MDDWNPRFLRGKNVKETVTDAVLAASITLDTACYTLQRNDPKQQQRCSAIYRVMD